MDHVRSRLDGRFSGPGAEATPWQETERVLETAPLFWITTVRRDGRPHVTPLVAVWHDNALYFGTGPGEQKAVNLEANAKVALTTGCNGWERGLDVVVEGEAERVTDAARLVELATAWEDKWDGRWQFQPVAEGFSHEGGEGIVHVFAVRPAKVLAFAKGPFSHTRYVFG
ncbi:MAG TPA: pyridoxamine 5'-phosphate oxidase family protein [Gaiellales bacterium]|jgi:general stress protein 26|nr:pyridoxamine 5'-phosphate oxidase family protein [Gaiellales bacterium]